MNRAVLSRPARQHGINGLMILLLLTLLMIAAVIALTVYP